MKEILIVTAVKSPLHLSQLPNEIKAHILDALPASAFLAMSRVSKDWYDQTQVPGRLRAQALALPDSCEPQCPLSIVHKQNCAALRHAVALRRGNRFCQYYWELPRDAVWWNVKSDSPY